MDLNEGSFILKNDDSNYSMSLRESGLRVINKDKVRAMLSPLGTFVLYGQEDGDPTTGITYIGIDTTNASVAGQLTFKNKLCSWEYDSTRQKYILVGEDIG